MAREDGEHRYRSREIVRGDPIETLLNSLTLDHIRDAASLLDPSGKTRIRSHKTSREDLAKTHRSNQEITETLLAVEALSAFKHCFVAQCDDPRRIQAAAQWLNQSLTEKSLDFVVRYCSIRGEHFYATFDHTVEVKDWVKEDEIRRRLETIETRHPIVVRLSLSSGLLQLHYPGFSQGPASKKSAQITYGEIVGALLGILERLAIGVRILPIKAALQILLTGENRRVHRIRADIEDLKVGRFDLSSLDKKKTVEEAVADLLHPHLSEVASRSQVIESAKKAIGEADTNFLVLFWADEQVTTRLHFWDIGCELLFVWGSEAPSYSTVDSILSLVLETRDKIDLPQAGEVLRWISKLPGDSIVRPAALAQHFDVGHEGARKELIYAVRAGMVRPVYRLATSELLIDSENSWTEDPTSLRIEWVTDQGRVIDGSDPRNVEVAFRRVTNAKGVV